MLSTLFLSKNQKLVKKWKKEHEQIVILATKVIGEYSKNNHDNAKNALRKLNTLAVDHVMNEDIEFYKLLKDQKRLTNKNEASIKHFTESFKGTKMALMNFLSKHTREDVILDDNFFNTFNELVGVLSERIDFEEENLYSILYAKN
jgi:hypothetical protein